jgi:AcrR family transcriptional regulator
MLTPPPSDRRTRKRLATRQRISDVATRLFIERGFDRVTVDEIAEAADVARMTVFNHFARKEDMFFDLDDIGREELLAALQTRDPATSPIEALRLFAHRAVAGQRPYVRFYDAGTDRFLSTLRASEALRARANAIRDELTGLLASALANAAQRPPDDPIARLATSLLVATWVVASTESQRKFLETQDIGHANAAFLSFIDRGIRGVKAAVEGTPYSE